MRERRRGEFTDNVPEEYTQFGLSAIFTPSCIKFILIIALICSPITLIKLVDCKHRPHNHHHHHNHHHNHHSHHLSRPATFQALETSQEDHINEHSFINDEEQRLDEGAQKVNDDLLGGEIVASPQPLFAWFKPTPPLEFVASSLENGNQEELDDSRLIAPNKVFTLQEAGRENFNYFALPESNLFSPIFQLQDDPLNRLVNIGERDGQAALYQNIQTAPQNLLDSNNPFDLIEPGSGGWENRDSDEANSVNGNALEDSNGFHSPARAGSVSPSPVSSHDYDRGVMSTPRVTENDSAADDGSMPAANQAPILSRRLPKLTVTAGQVWRYFIPLDTFLDEDGDLGQLKSSIFIKRPTDSIALTSQQINEQEASLAETKLYYSWLQYDQNSQLLYGFPTENDAGKHELLLSVSDKFGAISNETIEINVRQHQSTRAFTHLFVFNQVHWDRQRFPSMIDALGELIKRISARLFLDQPFKDFIVQYYYLDQNSSQPNPNNDTNQPTSNEIKSFTLAWSNASVPIYPCNLTLLDSLFRMLIDTSALADWSLERDDTFGQHPFSPSQELLRASGPEFRPTSIGAQLAGACEGKEAAQRASRLQQSTNADGGNLMLKVKMKIGKLSWKLGEPIEYRIPNEIFGSDEEPSSGSGEVQFRDLQMTMHTIDGLTFDKDPRYNFLEFDRESQTLFGLSYNQAEHAGQREIQLTARHPISGQKVREVFIINVEPQDLTTVNNRAFKMSLYLLARTGVFGPKERVSLGHKIAAALRYGDGEFFHGTENPELVVMDVQKFALPSYFREENGSSLSNKDNFPDRIVKLIDTANTHEEHFHLMVKSDSIVSHSTNFLYKFTWTNSSIGYRGDCPVEVIKENLLYALEQSMLKLRSNDLLRMENDQSKNDSVRFYNSLRLYFEPESDLIHLRFEPLGACSIAFELHDVGNSDIADQVDRAGELQMDIIQELTTLAPLMPVQPRREIEHDNDEYWSIVVLIVLVVVLIFVVIMFCMGMHTYKINQDKRFELQVRLAQARQNSMYLSSMLLANQAAPNGIGNHAMITPGMAKSMFVAQDEKKSSRKPVILDNEKQLLIDGIGGPNMKPSAVQLSGQTVHTTQLRSNMSFTLDSMSNGWQPPMSALNPSPSAMLFLDDKQRSVTLHRKPSNGLQHRMTNQQTSMNNLTQSQSILTVASLAGPIPIIPQPGCLPIVYAQVPLVNDPNAFRRNYSSLQRGFSMQTVPESPSASSRPLQGARQQPFYVTSSDNSDTARQTPQVEGEVHRN